MKNNKEGKCECGLPREKLGYHKCQSSQEKKCCDLPDNLQDDGILDTETHKHTPTPVATEDWEGLSESEYYKKYLLRIQGWAEAFEKDNSNVDIRWLISILKQVLKDK